MKLLLLGSTGDIGQYVVKRSLEGLPGATVTIFVRNKAKLEQLLDKNDLPKNAFKILEGDIRDLQALAAAFQHQEYCICTAGNAAKDPEEYRHIFAGVVQTAAAAMVGPKRLWMMAGVTVMTLPYSKSNKTINDLPIFSLLPFRVHSSNYEELLSIGNGLSWSLMCPGKLNNLDTSTGKKPVAFTEQAPLSLPQWLLSWPSLNLLTALLCLPQLSKFSVTLDDVAAAMVDDLKTGYGVVGLRVGLKKA